jgi:cell division protein FtsB
MAQKSTSQHGATAGGRRGTPRAGTRSGAARATTSKTSRSTSATRSASSTRKAAARGSSASSKRRPAPARRGPRTSPKWVPLIVVAIVAAIGWTMWPALKLEYQTSRNFAGLQQQYKDLKTRNASMEAQVAELKTPQGVEKAARENLGFVKEGEHAYVVMESGASTATPSVPASTTAEPRPAWQVVLDFVFGVPPR